MRIKQAEFLTSVAECKTLPTDGVPEIAVAGKSNVGKSSFINLLTNNSKLAKTSSTPGRTRLLNYFDINRGEFYLVDLPGYGFARVGADEQEKWAKMIEEYFATSQVLKHVIVLVDSRHEPSPLDLQMIAYLHHYNIPFTVIATKADKLSRQQANKQKAIIGNALKMAAGNIMMTSALKKSGVDEVLERIETILTPIE